MKAISIVISTAAIAAAASCTYNAVPEQGARHSVSISLHGDPVSSRITGSADESAINTVQIFIFDSNGKYLSSVRTDAPTAGTELFDGEYTICAVANSAEITAGSVSDIASLEACTVTLEANSADNIVMYGKKDCTISGGPASIDIAVGRKVARISVNRISNEIKDPLHKTQAFVIKRIFISNVNGSSPLQGEAAPEIWYNMNGLWQDEPQEIRELLEDSDIESEIPHTGSYDTAHYFYACANNTAEDSYGQTWSPRHTRLVVEASLGGDICYYNIPFADIKANHTYTINRLTVTKKGTENPWDKCESGEYGISITVTDWETGTSTDKVI